MDRERLVKKIACTLLLLAIISGHAPQAFADEGNCDAGQERNKKVVMFKVGTLVELPAGSAANEVAIVAVTVACTDEVLKIRKCAVNQVQKKGLQKYCFPTNGDAAYSDDYDLVEYYELKNQ